MAELDEHDIGKLVNSAITQLTAEYGFTRTEDMYQQGWLCAMQAIRSYDPARSVKISTWIYCRVHWGILDWLRSPAYAHLGRRQQQDNRDAIAAGKDPIWWPPTSYDATNERGEAWIDVIAGGESDSGFGEIETQLTLDAILRDAKTVCSPKQYAAVTAYYLDGLPMAAIGRMLGVCEARVSQLVSTGLARMRHRQSALRRRRVIADTARGTLTP